MKRAVAVDLGASSGRIAMGELEDGRVSYQILEQIPHGPYEIDGRLSWDSQKLLDLCRRAADVAESSGAKSLGIDAWGVDHGFLKESGELLFPPVCYRDLSHVAAFEALKPHRRRLYELTGIQHQPFNTICQFAARLAEDPSLPDKVSDWMILPDLLGYLLGGTANSELTEASTTQLLGTNGDWAAEAFEIAGWPLPPRAVTGSARRLGQIRKGVELVSVGSHDTASAVVGFGNLQNDELFLNVGTWSLAGCVIDQPITSVEAERKGFTNERTADGRVRFLKNIPGFYFINRLHEELEIHAPVPTWLQQASEVEEVIDLFHPDFFNPESMLDTCRMRLAKPPVSDAGWAGMALASLAEAVAQSAGETSTIVGRQFTQIRIGGGGSQSRELCHLVANRTGLQVSAGPVEATVLGNLVTQFLAQGELADWPEVYNCVGLSVSTQKYSPT